MDEKKKIRKFREVVKWTLATALVTYQKGKDRVRRSK